MTTVSQIIGQARYNAGAVAPSGGDATQSPTGGSAANDGYKSFGGSVVRNAAIGAAAGALVALPTGIGVPLGLGVGAAVGAGSALIRHPKVAGVFADGLKGVAPGAAGGALVGAVTPLGPVPGAIAGGIGGFLTGTVNGVMKHVAGGKYAIERETTVWGRIKRGFAMGAVTGAAAGLGSSLLFAGITAVPGALIGAAIGGIGGAMYGGMTGVTDAVTGAKGVTFTKGGGTGLPKLTFPWTNNGDGGSGSGSDGGYVGQNPNQSVMQCPPQKVA